MTQFHGNMKMADLVEANYHLLAVLTRFGIEGGFGERTVREICEKIAERIRELEDVTDCVFLGTDEFAESLIKYRLRLFTDPAKKRPTKRAANAVIQDVCAENGIEVPFNQLDVHIKNA